jgi:hypothetical protein
MIGSFRMAGIATDDMGNAALQWARADPEAFMQFVARLSRAAAMDTPTGAALFGAAAAGFGIGTWINGQLHLSDAIVDALMSSEDRKVAAMLAGATNAVGQNGGSAENSNRGAGANNEGQSTSPPPPEGDNNNDNNDKSKRTVQKGGRTLSNNAANELNETSGQNLNRREWGRALEELKKENGLRGDDHGTLKADGSWFDGRGVYRGNVIDYIK